MASRPIDLSSSARRPSYQSLRQNNTVGPFSAPETAAAAAQQFSPPNRQFSFGSNSQSLHQVNLPIQFSRRTSLPSPPSISGLSLNLNQSQPVKQQEQSANQSLKEQPSFKPVNKFVSGFQQKKRPYSPMGNAILEGQFLD